MTFARRITAFGGISPRTSPRLLPENGAIEATNCKLYSGELVPLRGVGNLYDPAKTGPFVSIFKARNGATDSAWFTWNIDVDCVRVPLATEVESRFCWTGDGAPKMAKYAAAVAGSGENYPVTASELMLGIPNPVTAPTVTPSGGVSATTVTRFYCYTFFSADGEESGPSPISLVSSNKIDATWAIAAMDLVPINSGTGTCAGNVFTAAAAHWLRVGDSVVVNSITRTVTVVSGLTFTFSGATATGSTTWARTTPWNTTGMTKRIYRTSGSLGAFQLVIDAIAAATTTYNDTIGDAQMLGDDLISDGWQPPPIGLKHMTTHPSGALLGFVGNILHASEPYQPHAWSTTFQWSADADIVGIACYNTEVVCVTKGSPHIASGVEPASMVMGDRIDGMYPGMSKRSVISVGDGVLYSSQHGLALVGQGGIKMFTEKWATKEEWRAYQPSTMIAAVANGRIYVNYTQEDGTSKTMVFEDGEMTTISLLASELYTDPATGTLYLGMTDGIYEWDAPTAYPLSQTWRSRAFYEPTPLNLGAAKINYELAIDPVTAAAIVALRASISITNAAIIAALQTGAAYGDYGYGLTETGGDALEPVPEEPPNNEVTFILYVDGEVYASRVVTSTKAFRLPAGKKYFDFGIQLSSQCKIQSVVIAETMEALKSV